MWPGNRWRLGALSAAVAIAALCLPGLAQAVDNPDAVDPVVAFEQRSSAFEQRLNEAPAAQTAALWAEQARFLDDELNRAYRDLLQRLSGPARQALLQSQRKWLAFRDSETTFIAAQWTPAKLGSSSALGRAQLRAALVSARVRQLLAHQRSLPAR